MLVTGCDLIKANLLTCDQFEGRGIDDIIDTVWFLYYIRRIYSILPCICSVIRDYTRHPNMVRTWHTRLMAHVPVFLFSLHFDMICDWLLNRSTATWNLLVI